MSAKGMIPSFEELRWCSRISLVDAGVPSAGLASESESKVGCDVERESKDDEPSGGWSKAPREGHSPAVVRVKDAIYDVSVVLLDGSVSGASGSREPHPVGAEGSTHFLDSALLPVVSSEGDGVHGCGSLVAECGAHLLWLIHAHRMGRVAAPGVVAATVAVAASSPSARSVLRCIPKALPARTGAVPDARFACNGH